MAIQILIDAIQAGDLERLQHLLIAEESLTQLTHEGRSLVDIAEEHALQSEKHERICALIRTRVLWEAQGHNFKLNALLSELRESYRAVKPAGNLDRLVVMGATGAGKSTLINHLFGVEYNEVEDSTTLRRVGEMAEVTTVGNNLAVSETKFPKIVKKSQEDNFVYCDMPGLFDTRTKEVKVCSANSMRILNRPETKVKGILVALPYFAFRTSRGDDVKEVLIKLAKMLKRNPILLDSVGFVITQCDFNRRIKKQVTSQDFLKFIGDVDPAGIDNEVDRADLQWIKENLLSTDATLKIVSYDVTYNECRSPLEQLINSFPDSQSSSQFDFSEMSEAQEEFDTFLLEMAEIYLEYNNQLHTQIPEELNTIASLIEDQTQAKAAQLEEGEAIPQALNAARQRRELSSNRMSEIQQQIEQLNARKKELEIQRAEEKGKLEAQNDLLLQLNQQREAIQAHQIQNEAELNNRQALRDQKSAEHQQASALVQQNQDSQAHLQQACEQAERALAQIRRDLESKRFEQNQMQRQLAATETAIAASETKIAKLRQKEKAASEQIRALNQQIDALPTVAAMEEQLACLTQRRREAVEQMEAAHAEQIESARRGIAEKIALSDAERDTLLAEQREVEVAIARQRETLEQELKPLQKTISQNEQKIQIEQIALATLNERITNTGQSIQRKDESINNVNLQKYRDEIARLERLIAEDNACVAKKIVEHREKQEAESQKYLEYCEQYSRSGNQQHYQNLASKAMAQRQWHMGQADALSQLQELIVNVRIDQKIAEHREEQAAEYQKYLEYCEQYSRSGNQQHYQNLASTAMARRQWHMGQADALSQVRPLVNQIEANTHLLEIERNNLATAQAQLEQLTVERDGERGIQAHSINERGQVNQRITELEQENVDNRLTMEEKTSAATAQIERYNAQRATNLDKLKAIEERLNTYRQENYGIPGIQVGLSQILERLRSQHDETIRAERTRQAQIQTKLTELKVNLALLHSQNLEGGLQDELGNSSRLMSQKEDELRSLTALNLAIEQLNSQMNTTTQESNQRRNDVVLAEQTLQASLQIQNVRAGEHNNAIEAHNTATNAHATVVTQLADIDHQIALKSQDVAAIEDRYNGFTNSLEETTQALNHYQTELQEQQASFNNAQEEVGLLEASLQENEMRVSELEKQINISREKELQLRSKRHRLSLEIQVNERFFSVLNKIGMLLHQGEPVFDAFSQVYQQMHQPRVAQLAGIGFHHNPAPQNEIAPIPAAQLPGIALA